MNRYFLEVSYKGTAYSGFQKQENANTIQSEVEKALAVLYKQPFELTGSSRTDAGVHAFQNFFHFDTGILIDAKRIYNLNALLPLDISVQKIYQVSNEKHCRFNAISREYKYSIYFKKNPFLQQTAYYYPYNLNEEALAKAADLIKQHKNFAAFSKRNTQVKTFACDILLSEWIYENNCLIYHVTSNRFLRGMIRGLVGTMLRIGRGMLSIDEFKKLLNNDSVQSADFSVPANGLCLIHVNYPQDFFSHENR